MPKGDEICPHSTQSFPLVSLALIEENIVKKFLQALTFCFVTMCNTSICFAQNNKPAYSQEHIKALYLLHLTQFINWQQPVDNHNVCVVGDDGFKAKLIQISKHLRVASTLSVESKNLLSDFEGCDILYISKNAEFEMRQILHKTSDHPTLTVSDSLNFIHQGGGIGFALKDNTIKIEVNNSLLKEKRFSINSELLEIAKKVI